MISSKKLMKMVRKWQKLAIKSSKRIAFSRTAQGVEAEDCSTSSPVKGHVVVYSADERSFAIPLAYLSNDLFRELLRMAVEEYGLPCHGPITLSCDAVFIMYAISLTRRHAAKDMEKALLATISAGRCLGLHQEQGIQQFLLCSF